MHGTPQFGRQFRLQVLPETHHQHALAVSHISAPTCACCLHDALEYGLIDEVIMPDAAQAEKATAGRCTVKHDHSPKPPPLPPMLFSTVSHTAAPCLSLLFSRLQDALEYA
jgi:hypothetical protein